MLDPEALERRLQAALRRSEGQRVQLEAADVGAPAAAECEDAASAGPSQAPSSCSYVPCSASTAPPTQPEDLIADGSLRIRLHGDLTVKSIEPADVLASYVGARVASIDGIAVLTKREAVTLLCGKARCTLRFAPRAAPGTQGSGTG